MHVNLNTPSHTEFKVAGKIAAKQEMTRPMLLVKKQIWQWNTIQLYFL